MRKELEKTLELYTANVQAVRNGFAWHHTLIKHLAALLYTGEGRAVDMQALKATHRMVKQNTSAFSYFRGNLAVAITALLSLSARPEEQLEDMLEAYKALKGAGFYGSDYLTVAAYQMAADAKRTEYEAIAERARAFYKGMKKNHWLLTGQNDHIYCVMLAITGMDVEEGLARMERLYGDLQPVMKKRDSTQALAQVMVVSEATAATEEKVLALREAFRAAGNKLDRQYTLSSMGILALLPYPAEQIAAEVCGLYDTLRTQKGFGAWSLNKQELLLLCCALVSYASIHDIENDVVASTVSTNVASIIIAQQAAIIACVAATTAATTASSSASGS